MYNYTHLLSVLLLFLLPATVLSAPHENVNRTFTITVYREANPIPGINGQQLLVNPPSGVGSAVVGTNIAPGSTEPLVLFIYNGDIFRKCTTSPTGACLGFLTKVYGGALTGWSFQFSDTEQPLNLGPGDGPLRGGFAVQTDPDAPTGGSQCASKRKVLYSGSSTFWTLCTYDPAGVYGINSSPIPDFAHNGPQCSQGTGYKFRVTYT